jgi:uncharacterized protein (TIGR02145 family)
LSNRINAKSSLTDTGLFNLTTRFETKLSGADTVSLSNRINAKSSLSDTGLLNLTTRFSTKLSREDTTSLSNRINAKSSLSDTSLLNLTTRFETKLSGADTVSLSTRINAKSSLSDTSLLNLTTRFEMKLSGADTTSLSNRMNAKLSKTDTASLSDRINSKLDSTVIPSTNSLKGYIMYWNGSSWVLLNPGTAGQVLRMSSASELVPVWGTDATTSVPAFSPCGTTISDIDGNTYNTVLIGAQCWTKENLRVRRYNNGTAIPFDNTGGSGGNSSTWQNLTIGAHTIYAHDSTATTPSNLTKYGYLYNWYAAKGIYTTGTIVSTDTLNICPSGWHVPSDTEWTTLTTELGGESVAGGKMKSIGTAYWSSQSTGTDNSSGFSALPGGYRYFNGSFNSIRYNAFFWSATELDYSNAWYRFLNATNVIVNRYSGVSNNSKSSGASVRCLKN